MTELPFAAVHWSVWLAPAVTDGAATAPRTSMTTSPAALDASTVGPVPVPVAEAKLSNGVVWFTSVKVTAPAATLAAAESVTTMLFSVPTAGASRYQSSTRTLVPFATAPLDTWVRLVPP